MKEIRFEFPDLPVSVNKLYVVVRGRKVLSSQGREFRNRFVGMGGGVPPMVLAQFEADVSTHYQLHIWFYLPFEELYNLGYGTSRRTKYPFKKLDTSNMVKLPEDCISALTGVDDRQNWSVCLHKRESPDDSRRIVALLKPLNMEEDPYREPI